jgi:hypothetical protein
MHRATSLTAAAPVGAAIGAAWLCGTFGLAVLTCMSVARRQVWEVPAHILGPLALLGFELPVRAHGASRAVSLCR